MGEGQIVGGRVCGKGQGSGGKKGGKGVGQGGGVKGGKGVESINEVFNKTGIVTRLGCHNERYDTKSS